MNSIFYEIYTELRFSYLYLFQRQFINSFDYSRAEEELTLLNRQIIEIEESMEVSLRPDAKLLLLSNFHLMILIPLNHRFAGKDSRNLMEDINSDLRRIIERARAEQNRELSGGAILRAITDLWNDLRVNATNIWT